MYFIAAFGLLLSLLSLIMVISPQKWSLGIISFANKPYFHWFEVSSRFLVGIIFIALSDTFAFPLLLMTIGCLFVAVSIGLTVIGERKHRAFAYWSARKFRHVFRPAGIVSLLFGLAVIYASLFSH